MKVWKLPAGSPTSKGKALVNLLPLNEGETIADIMALPSDEESWADLNVMFATSSAMCAVTCLTSSRLTQWQNCHEAKRR